MVFQQRLHEHWRRASQSPPILHKPNRTPIPSYSEGPGVFRPAARNEHLYSYCNFAESVVETAEKSLRHSCRSEPPDKEFRYLRMVIVTTAVYWGLNSQLRHRWLTGPLNLPAPGRRRSVYIVLRLRTDLCFSKQSLLSGLCDHPSWKAKFRHQGWSPSPEVTGHFAEFLNHSSLDRLSILYLTTCVGLGYGPCTNSLEAFLGSIGSWISPQRLRITSQDMWDTDLPMSLPTGLHQHYHRLAPLPSCVTPSLGYYNPRSHAAPAGHPKAVHRDLDG